MKDRIGRLRILNRDLEPALDVRQLWSLKVNGQAQAFMESLSTATGVSRNNGESCGSIALWFKTAERAQVFETGASTWNGRLGFRYYVDPARISGWSTRASP